jgi:hypothetical protein
MRQTIIFLAIFFGFIGSGFCQEKYLPKSYYIAYPNRSFEFENNKIKYWNDDKTLIGTYYLEDSNGIKFINIKFENGQNEKYIILFNENLCYFFNINGLLYFRGFTFERGARAAPGEACFSVAYDNVKIISSSHLIEGNITYSTDNLIDRISVCWAEGVDGHGINEKLYLQMNNETRSIHISTGLVSYRNPNFFKENSRPKIIELSVRNKYSIIVNLEDTPNFHTINLPQTLMKDEILELKIIDVYPGTKHEDTCINIILMDYSKY